MIISQLFTNIWGPSWYFFGWRDCIEILFFSCVFYMITRWLAKDRTKNLLPYFYGYCICAGIAHALQLQTIAYCLFLFAPGLIMLFMFMHQETLQRNLVALKNIAVPQQPSIDWLETFIRACLVARNNNKSITCVLEYTDNLSPFIDTSFTMHAMISQGILDFLLASPSYNANKIIWIDSTGILRGINAQWKHTHYNTGNDTLLSWEEEALMYTAKTDALIIHANPQTSSFTIVVHGTLSTALSSQQTLITIKKHINYKPTPPTKGGIIYDTYTEKHATEQRIS